MEGDEARGPRAVGVLGKGGSEKYEIWCNLRPEVTTEIPNISIL